MAAIVEGFSLSHAQVLDGTTSFLDALASNALESEDIYGVNEASLDPDTGDYDNEGDDAVLGTWSWFNFADLAVQAGYFSFPLIANLTSRPVDITEGTTPAVNEVQELSVSTATAGDFTLSFGGETTEPIAFDATSTVVQAALDALTSVNSGDIVVSGGPANTAALVFTFGGAYGGMNVASLVVDNTGLTGTGGAISVTTPGSSGSADAIWQTDLWHEDSMNVPPKPMIVKIPSKDNLGNVRALALGLYRVQFKPLTFDGPSYKDGLKVNYNGRSVMSPVDETGSPFSDGRKRVGRVISYQTLGG